MSILDYKKLYGLIGYPLSHSFSKRYFSEKFAKANITDSFYGLFPIQKIEELPALIKKHPNLRGLNVTIPYKEAVFPYLDFIDEEAQTVGAVNTIKIQDGKLAGYNTDVYGFEVSLKKMLQKQVNPPTPNPQPPIANSPILPNPNSLILGTGGAAKAIVYVLEKLNIPYLKVSRSADKGDLTYQQIDQKLLSKYHLIINTTPLGMSPKIDTFPPISYSSLGKDHFLYDLVYNPEITSFLEKGKAQGASIQNGLEMLYLQAEKSWKIWNESKQRTYHK